MGELVDGCRHSSTFLAELDSAPDNRDVWGAHDYIGALHLRDALDRGLGLLSGTERDDAARRIGNADRELEAQTEPDQDGLIHGLVSNVEGGDGWWWQRIPVRGPVRDEFDVHARGTR